MNDSIPEGTAPYSYQATAGWLCPADITQQRLASAKGHKQMVFNTATQEMDEAVKKRKGHDRETDSGHFRFVGFSAIGCALI